MIGPLAFADIYSIMVSLRAADRREVDAALLIDPLKMSLATQDADYGFGVRSNAEYHSPTAFLAAHDLGGGTWQVGLLATDDWPEVAREVTKYVHRVTIPWFLDHSAEKVQCYSIVGHDDAHRWLRRLGAHESEPAPYGRLGLPFKCFTWNKGDFEHVHSGSNRRRPAPAKSPTATASA